MKTQVVDKHGNVVERDGPLLDGDAVRVPHRMMDSTPAFVLTDAQRAMAQRGIERAMADRALREAQPSAIVDQWIADLRRPADRPPSLVTDQARAAGAYDAMSATIRDAWQGDKRNTDPQAMAATDAESAYEAMRRHLSAAYKAAA